MSTQRYNVDLGPRAQRAMTEAVQAGDSSADVFNRAVPLYALVTKAIARGGKVLIHNDGDEHPTELHIL